MLGQNHSRTQALSIRAVAALPNVIEPIAWSHHPGIMQGPLPVLAKVLEDRRIVRRYRSEVIKRLIDSRRKARRRHVMPQNAFIHHLRIKRGLRKERLHHVGDVLLPFRSKGLFVPRAPAKRYDHHLLVLQLRKRAQRRKTEKRRGTCHARRRSQKIAPAPGDAPCHLTRVDLVCSHQFFDTRMVVTCLNFAFSSSFSCWLYFCCKAISACAFSCCPV